MAICPRTGDRYPEPGMRTGHGSYSVRDSARGALDEGDRVLGRCLGRSFAVISLLGHGTMGTVYEATHLQLGRQCAIKVLRPELVSDTKMRERFRREARAIALLNHPNLVKVYDYDVEDDGTSYIAMEFVDSDTLASLQPYRGLPLAAALHIMLQLLAALSEAHSNGVVHRDLKPDNLAICHFVGHPYFVKVLDFGLAKLIESQAGPAANQLTMAGEILGTPQYMSPEQAIGVEHITHSTDIYAFGAMAFELLTGRPPYEAQGRTALQIMMQHVNGKIPPLEPRDGLRCSDALVDVVMCCLAKKPEQRYPTALDVIRALEDTPEARALHRGSEAVTIPGAADAAEPASAKGGGKAGSGFFGRFFKNS